VTYIITNLDACVAAANQQSEQDYADLLISSGYMTLVQLNAVLRHAATQPDHSETVSGNTVLLRSPQKWTPATVHSRDTSILFTLTGDIQAQAQRQEQKVKAFVNCTTQAVDRVPPLLQYRVFLRTIGSAVPPSRWSEPDYTSIQSVSYVADPLNAGFKRLALHTVFDNMLSEKLLIQGTSAPGTRHSEDTLTLQAHTFDWWIPVAPNPKIRNVASATMTNRSSDANQISRLPFGVHASKFAAVSSDSIRNDPSIVAGLGWEDGTQYWQGQHREMSLSSVEVRYKLDWKEDRLHLVVENRPSDRNYVLFLVIEETFGSIEPDEIPPKVLHTAIPVPINGLLTYVPQSFFDQEKAAADKLKALLSKYVETATPKLGDPVARAMRPGETMTDAGAERLVAALQQFDPQMLETLVRARHS
jgi:hypothetical protein